MTIEQKHDIPGINILFKENTDQKDYKNMIINNKDLLWQIPIYGSLMLYIHESLET